MSCCRAESCGRLQHRAVRPAPPRCGRPPPAPHARLECGSPGAACLRSARSSGASWQAGCDGRCGAPTACKPRRAMPTQPATLGATPTHPTAPAGHHCRRPAPCTEALPPGLSWAGSTPASLRAAQRWGEQRGGGRRRAGGVGARAGAWGQGPTAPRACFPKRPRPGGRRQAAEGSTKEAKSSACHELCKGLSGHRFLAAQRKLGSLHDQPNVIQVVQQQLPARAGCSAGRTRSWMGGAGGWRQVEQQARWWRRAVQATQKEAGVARGWAEALAALAAGTITHRMVSISRRRAR